MNIIEIIKPRAPKAKIPKADTFDIKLISLPVGFLATLNTLIHLPANSLILKNKDI